MLYFLSRDVEASGSTPTPSLSPSPQPRHRYLNPSLPKLVPHTNNSHLTLASFEHACNAMSTLEPLATDLVNCDAMYTPSPLLDGAVH